MANPQLKDGFTRIANELMEAIYRTKFNGTQFRIVMAVIRNTYGYNKIEHEMSDNFIANATGINARQIKKELKKLIEDKVLIVTDEGSYTEPRKIKLNKYYDEWTIDSVVAKKTSPTQLDTGGELDTSDEKDTSVEIDTTASVQIDTTSENEKSPLIPLDDSNTNGLSWGGDKLDTSGKLDTKKRHYKDIYKDITTTTTTIEGSDELDTSVEIDTTSNDELRNLTEKVLDYYSTLIGKPVYTGQDISTFRFLSEIGAKGIDLEIIKEAMGRSKGNWKPKYPGQKLRTFNYFMPAIEEAVALKKEELNNARTEDRESRRNDRKGETQHNKPKQYGTFL